MSAISRAKTSNKYFFKYIFSGNYEIISSLRRLLGHFSVAKVQEVKDCPCHTALFFILSPKLIVFFTCIVRVESLIKLKKLVPFIEFFLNLQVKGQPHRCLDLVHLEISLLIDSSHSFMNIVTRVIDSQQVTESFILELILINKFEELHLSSSFP